MFRLRSRWGARSCAAILAAIGVACGGGSGSSLFVFGAPFPPGFLPYLLDGAGDGTGDAAFEPSGDLVAVDGSDTVTRIAKSDGAVTQAATGVGGGAALRAILASNGMLYAGDDAGMLWEIDDAGASTLLADTGTGEPVTGLVEAPNAFGDFGGSLIAAVGAAGIYRVNPTAESPAAVLLSDESEYVDVAFSGTTLYALDTADTEIDTITSGGTSSTFLDHADFQTPVGMGIDVINGEILIADAGDDVLRSAPLEGGGPVDLAPYDFSTTAPSGIALDGNGAIALVTAGSTVLRGAIVPPLIPENLGLAISGTTVGYGDLEFEREGSLLALANDPDDPGDPDDSFGNGLLDIGRGGSVGERAIDIGADGEDLLGLAHDPFGRDAYIGTSLGNVFVVDSADAVSLLVDATGDPDVAVLGLEIAPETFGAFGGMLVATTDDGRVLVIDPAAPDPPMLLATIMTATASPGPARLSDLVFRLDGTLYVLDSGTDDASSPEVPRILEVEANGTATPLGFDSNELGRPDGLEIDEGGDRLLVTSDGDPGSDELLELMLDGSNTITVLQNILVDDGYFPTGVVYDGLGRAAVHGGDGVLILDVSSTFGP